MQIFYGIEVLTKILLAFSPAKPLKFIATGHGHGSTLKNPPSWPRFTLEHVIETSLSVMPFSTSRSARQPIMMGQGFGSPKSTLDKKKKRKKKNRPVVTQSELMDTQLKLVAPTTSEDIIPREVLFEDQSDARIAISPDGKMLAYYRRDDKGLNNLWCRTIGQNDDRMISSGWIDDDSKKSRKVITTIAMFWAQDSKTLLRVRDTNGREKYNLVALDVTQSPPVEHNLINLEDMTVSDVIMNRHFPETVLVVTRDTAARVFDASSDIYRCDLASGKVTLDSKLPDAIDGFISRRWQTDVDSFQICSATGFVPTREEVKLMGHIWPELFSKIRFPEEMLEGFALEGVVQFLDFAKDGKSILAVCQDETTHLCRFNLQTGLQDTIASNDKCDIDKIFLDEDSKEVLAVSFNYARTEYVFFDKAFEAEFRKLEAITPEGSEVSIVSPVTYWQPRRPKTNEDPVLISRCGEGQKWIVTYSYDDRPPQFLVYDRVTGVASPIFESQPLVSNYKLAHMEDVRIEARDGLELVAYLTRADSEKATPLVLLVHGGPATRDVWGFQPEVQLLANRGYAVLQVNFRGSSGYGRSFKEQEQDQWGVGSMQHDLSDAVAWAIKEGIALEDKICIYGSSYGGYACLAGLTFTPELYACGIDKCGMSNLAYIGCRDNELNQKISPLFHVDKIRAPLLIAQGGRDPRVPQRESDQIAFALQERKNPVEYILYPDEGHLLGQPANIMAFFSTMELFLARHLGGRAEDIEPKQIQRSTAIFPLLGGTQTRFQFEVPPNGPGTTVDFSLGPGYGNRRIKIQIASSAPVGSTFTVDVRNNVS